MAEQGPATWADVERVLYQRRPAPPAGFAVRTAALLTVAAAEKRQSSMGWRRWAVPALAAALGVAAVGVFLRPQPPTAVAEAPRPPQEPVAGPSAEAVQGPALQDAVREAVALTWQDVAAALPKFGELPDLRRAPRAAVPIRADVALAAVPRSLGAGAARAFGFLAPGGAGAADGPDRRVQ